MLALSDSLVVHDIDDHLHSCRDHADRHHDDHSAQACLVASLVKSVSILHSMLTWVNLQRQIISTEVLRTNHQPTDG